MARAMTIQEWLDRFPSPFPSIEARGSDDGPPCPEMDVVGDDEALLPAPQAQTATPEALRALSSPVDDWWYTPTLTSEIEC